MSRKPQRLVRLLAALGLMMSSAGVAVLTAMPAQATTPDADHKDYICKFTRTPGGIEIEQKSGQNPIFTDVAASEAGWFNDGQFLSYVLYHDVEKMDPEPTAADCWAVFYPEYGATASITKVDPTCDNPVGTFTTGGENSTASPESGTGAAGETVEVTFTAETLTVDGFTFQTKFAENAQTSITKSVTFATPTGCPTPDEPATPAAPSFVDPSCDVAASWSAPALVEGVTGYELSGTVAPGETVTVTAVLADGYVLADGASGSWSHTFGAAPTDAECNPDTDTPVTPAGPSFTDPTCDVDASWSAPALTDGVTGYELSGTVAPGETVTVTAVLADGYVLADGATGSWEHTFAAAPEDCGGTSGPTVVVAKAPAFTEVSCDPETQTMVGQAKVLLPEVAGIDYAVEGQEEPGGTVDVNATAELGFQLSGTVTWKHTFDEAPSDCNEVLPPTCEDLGSCPPEPCTTAARCTQPEPLPPVAPVAHTPGVVLPTSVKAGVVDEMAAQVAQNEALRATGLGLVGAGAMLLLGSGFLRLRRHGEA